MLKKTFFIWCFTLFGVSLYAQKAPSDFKAKYNTSKQLLDQGKYGLAMQSFKSLLSDNRDNELVPFAEFYLGAAAYYAGDISYSKNVFLKITVDHPSWVKNEAAFLWLSRIGFEQSGPFKGMLYATRITTEPYLTESNNFVKGQLALQPIDVLKELNAQYSENKLVVEAYALALSELPNSFETTYLLDSLIDKFDFDRSQFTSIPQTEFKDHYRIGILLPLFIDRLEASGKYLNKSLAVDIYEGAKMAAYDTDSTLFSLQVFDTKKDSSQLSILLDSAGLSELDAILGPIYPKPVSKMMAIASKEKINFLNPTSSNSSISDSSPYAFLSRAGASKLSEKAAAYMKTQAINKNLFIYYGTSEVDSISAYVYKEAMEADSFNVVATVKIGAENRRQVYDMLTASVSITDREKLGKMTKEEIQNLFQLPKIDSLLIQPDSIGHLFIASGDPTVPTEAMSAIISRGDSISIMGVGNWFESNNAGLGIMEGLGVTLAISAVDDVATSTYKEIRRKYVEKFKSQPSKYFFRGYFGMKAITESLKNYGTYFQQSYRQQGNFSPLYNFKNSNSNQAIKIIKLVDNYIQEIEIENKDVLE